MNASEKPRSVLFAIGTVAAASSISLIGGLSIELVADKLLPIVPLLIAMPTLNTMVGDYSTIVASYEEAGLKGNLQRSLRQAIAKSVTINVCALVILSMLLAIRRGYALETDFLIKYSLFIAFATVFVVVTVFVISKILNRLLRKNHLNADDVLIPVITSFTDVLMLSLISISVLTIF